MDNEKPNINQLEGLSTAWNTFAESFYEEKTFALLYASNKCFLGLVNKAGDVEVKSGHFDLAKVFEARIFNGQAELRWLKGFCEKIVSDDLFTNDRNFVQKLGQNYLIWGEKIKEDQKGNWTKFGTARIGTFSIPVEAEKVEKYAQFTAVEYLMSDGKNGNVFVADERLTGISEVE